jgi:hypothetical protein
VLLAGALALSAGSSVPAGGEEAPVDSTTGGPTILPIPIIFYTPETETGFGGSMIYIADPEARLPSSLSAVAIYTTKSQTVLRVGASWYVRKEQLRLDLEGGYSEFPDTFYGVADGREEIAEDYTPRTGDATLGAWWHLPHDLQIGVQGGFASQSMEVVEEDGLLDRGVIPGSEGGTIASLGFGLTWDTRDRSLYPRSGVLGTTGITVAGSGLGSDFTYEVANVDLRGYRSLGTKLVLAGQAVATRVTGHPPFQTLATFGGDALLRGVYAGRFRDRALLAGQAEVRAPLFWRIGGVAYYGVADVAEDLDRVRAPRARGAGGVGIRFALDRENPINLRVDVAWSRDDSGFYIQFMEAF